LNRTVRRPQQIFAALRSAILPAQKMLAVHDGARASSAALHAGADFDLKSDN
jgi:hypothetical protein